MTVMYLNRPCVYRHTLEGEIIYIGKGKNGRPYDLSSRGEQWKKVVTDSTKIKVDILAWFENDKEALRVESILIDSYQPSGNVQGRDWVETIVNSVEWVDDEYEEATSVRITCVDTGKTFMSVEEVAETLLVSLPYMQSHLQGDTPHIRGRRYKYQYKVNPHTTEKEYNDDIK